MSKRRKHAPAMHGSAEFSPCGRYRYTLERQWNLGPYDPQARRVLWVMLNPSTADEERNDPTVTRCVLFSQRWGFDGLVVVNLFALRATDPRDLYRAHPDEVVGEENDQHIVSQRLRCHRVVAAWGAHGALQGRASEVLHLLAPDPVLCLGRTTLGYPRHPLYMRGDVEPEVLS